MTDSNEKTGDSVGESDKSNQPSVFDVVLDLQGLNCPLPILRTKLALSKMQPGQILHATTTDPMSVIDYRVFCERTGHELIETVESSETFNFTIRCVADARDDAPGSAN